MRLMSDERAHSRTLLEGPNRAPARAMMRAVGFRDEDFARPLVLVSHAYTDLQPCNFNHRTVAEWVKEGVREEGGTPIEAKTISVGVMALARLDLPGLMLYGGSIMPGRFEGKDVTIQDVFEAVGAHARGSMTDAQLREIELG